MYLVRPGTFEQTIVRILQKFPNHVFADKNKFHRNLQKPDGSLILQKFESKFKKKENQQVAKLFQISKKIMSVRNC